MAIGILALVVGLVLSLISFLSVPADSVGRKVETTVKNNSYGMVMPKEL